MPKLVYSVSIDEDHALQRCSSNSPINRQAVPTEINAIAAVSYVLVRAILQVTMNIYIIVNDIIPISKFP